MLTFAALFLNLFKMNKNTIISEIISNAAATHQNLTPSQLVEKSVSNGEGSLTSTGALAADTGEFTGRSPKDKYTVADQTTNETVWWGNINQKFDETKFDNLVAKIINHYKGKELYIRDAKACADERFAISIKVVTETAFQNLFVHHMFLRPTEEEIAKNHTDWIILAAPSFLAIPEIDGTKAKNFSIINFSKKIYIIGGSGYTGEIKKGIFTVLNYSLPIEHNVLSMHCSANMGINGDSAIFFGLSGTGKTTLSADPNRKLIGDDEHGWANDSVFNFEGGCYAKTINLSQENEPTIWNAIKENALLENVRFFENSNVVNYDDVSATENTRCAYPIYNVENIATPSMGPAPKNIFFLTADAFGVFPPISKLTKSQAMYFFISGYTAKVAGTEIGVVEPQATFSPCFGAAFLPLHPGKYAEMLGNKLSNGDANVWLINTGWTGGEYGIGTRIKLKYTRAMIDAALNGNLENVDYEIHEVFGIQIPKSCPNVPTELLNPRETWANKPAYNEKANHLAKLFIENFAKYSDGVSEEILNAAPKITEQSYS